MCSEGISNNICLPDNYSKFDLPKPDGLNLVYISIDIEDVLEINDKDYSITFATFLNVEWLERRLHVDPDFMSLHSNDKVLVTMDLEFLKDLWLPNLFIYNLKTFTEISVLSNLAGLWIDPNKNVLHSLATHISFICPMSFDKFPLDEQRCVFQVGSYSYDNSKMMFFTKSFGYSSKKSNTFALDYAISKYSK